MTQTATLPLLLKQLRLTSFYHHWETMLEQSTQRSWDAAQYLTALCEQELADRHSRRISRYTKESQLPPGKTLSSFDFSQVPELKAEQIEALAMSTDWTRQARNLLLFGASGVGKTHLAAAIGHGLIERGVRVRHYTTTALVQQLQQARAQLELESKGGDMISLYRYLNSCREKTAINALSKFVREQGFTKRSSSIAEKKRAPKRVKKVAPPAEPIKPEALSALPPDMDVEMNPVEQTYEYRNEKGEIVFYVCRVKTDDEGGKDVKPVMFTEKGGWKWRLPQGPHPLYNCDLINADTIALFGEGEKVADHLDQFPGCVGVTSVGGSGRLRESDLSSLEKAKEVIIFPDGDDPGAKYAAQAAAYCAIYERPASMVDVEALKWTDGKDAADEPDLAMDDYEKHLITFDAWGLLSRENRRIADEAYYQIGSMMDDAEYGRQRGKISALLGRMDLRVLKKNVDLHRPVVAKTTEDEEEVEEEMTPAEIEAARAEIYPRIKHIAKAPNILDLVQETLSAMGIVGECD
jgi:hypothetical protein